MTFAKQFALEGKVALVTGGGTGLGRAIAEGFLAAGCSRVYIASRKAEAIAAAAHKIDSNGRCVAVAVDLSNLAGVSALADAIAEREARLDILVNNAGLAWGAPFDHYPERGWDKVFGLNLKAPFFLIQALLGLLRAGGSPEDPARVINIGSIAGEMAKGTTTYSYGLSKSALHHMTRMLALDLGSSNITVNTIAPGRFASPLTASIVDDPERHAREAAMVPLGRWGTTAELGSIAIFLASPAAAYVTGATLVADGGLSLQHPINLGME
ncbi:SDR family oxidoreductase [Novosphingobium cyanobacteriorum]|uniref:SDR family oxidoreductase n=1 Tax=Novosphingobium cyanobacteriorum TaxID=3024215 RepID=A0ABT6CR05_9SPHN|nr:SDR family oxidoreductase [Novosphingobium cyanobacteriorum]MDF8335670.1 SDR family oxidoreductase [Novosphingobium cyanobacteriorum]